MGKIRFGIIGCGQISQVGHIPNLSQIDDAEITAVSDLNDGNIKAALKMASNAKAFKDYIELLNQDNVDVVVIATPNWLHCEQALAALGEGKHVFCEKPLGIDPEECQKILEANRKNGKLLQVGHELRHAKVFETAKEKISSGIIGDVKIIRYSEFRKPLLQGWRQTGKTGGVMLEKNSHFFDLFNWFADSNPKLVMGIGANDVNKESPLIDNCFVTVEYENNVKASLTMCLFCENGGQNGMEIVGTKGMLRIFDETLEFFTRTSEEKEKIDCSVSPREGMHMGCRREFEHMIECLKNKLNPRNNPESAFKTLKLALAAEEAIRTNSIINI